MDGQDITEPGGSNEDKLFFMKLTNQETTTTGTSIVSPSSVDVTLDMSGNTAGRNSGQYKVTFKYNIVDGHDKVSGADRSILHYRVKDSVKVFILWFSPPTVT